MRIPESCPESIPGCSEAARGRQTEAMPQVRLIRQVNLPTGRGPGNGQYALQKALRVRGVGWLSIGGRLHEEEIPWFWSWEDRDAAARCAQAGRPFILGPNVLFENSRRPCRVRAERILCRAASCRLMFTESQWYRRLIEEHRGPQNRAPIVIWPYPIDPAPGGPLPPRQDLLIYAKNGYPADLIGRLRQSYRRSLLVHYGRYRRTELFEAARCCRACVYLSGDDRGPLALAEILLSGCPVVGVPTGAPFVRHGRSGILLERFDAGACIDAVEDCLELDRYRVAALAAEQFDTDRIVATVLGALREASFEDNKRKQVIP